MTKAPANTHAVAYLGIASFVIGLLCNGPFQAALQKALPSAAANWLGLVFIVAGFAGAYFGMPATVKES